VVNEGVEKGPKRGPKGVKRVKKRLKESKGVKNRSKIGQKKVKKLFRMNALKLVSGEGKR